jgi:hypothetical protein
VLARIPEGSNYRLDPKSRTAQEIAWQIYCEEKVIIKALESGSSRFVKCSPATCSPILNGFAMMFRSSALRK